MNDIFHCGICGHIFLKSKSLKGYTIAWTCVKCGCSNVFHDEKYYKPSERDTIICSNCKKYIMKAKVDNGKIEIKCPHCEVMIEFP